MPTHSSQRQSPRAHNSRSVRQPRTLPQQIAAALIIIAGFVVVLLVVTIGLLFFRPASQSKTQTVTQDASSASSTIADRLSLAVLPQNGYTIPVTWGDLGQRLVAAGGIDIAQYNDIYTNPAEAQLLTYLTQATNNSITVTAENSYFWVNTLWALGLTQSSDVLTKGIIGTQYADQVDRFASTGGWTLGSKDSVALFSSTNLLSLDSGEEARIAEITAGIYRPCCGNPSSFPDCNHGMAILGLVELMVDQGFTDAEIYNAALAFNAYWFPQTYIDLAYYFEEFMSTPWEDVDAKVVLSQQYSSAQGYQTIRQSIGSVPGLEQSGGSCSA